MPKKRKAAGSAGEKPLKKTKTGSPPPSEKPAAKKAVVQQQQRDPYKALLMQIHPSLRFMPSSRKLVSDLVAAVGQVLMHSRGGELRKCRTVAAVKAALACPAFTKPAGELAKVALEQVDTAPTTFCPGDFPELGLSIDSDPGELAFVAVLEFFASEICQLAGMYQRDASGGYWGRGESGMQGGRKTNAVTVKDVRLAVAGDVELSTLFKVYPAIASGVQGLKKARFAPVPAPVLRPLITFSRSILVTPALLVVRGNTLNL
jgi:hypothetical protein